MTVEKTEGIEMKRGRYVAYENFKGGTFMEYGNTHQQAVKNCLQSIKSWVPGKFN